MQLKSNNISFDEAINFANVDNIILKRRNNDMLLSDYQISILNRNGLNYMDYANFRELLFDIEECLYLNYDEQLDYVSSQIAELLYYSESKK